MESPATATTADLSKNPQNYALFAPKTSGAYTELISIGPELIQTN
jgi:hypothetical protein